MSTEDSVQSLRAALEQMRRQLAATPGLTPKTIQDLLGPLRAQIAELEGQAGAPRLDLREQRVGAQVLVAGNVYAGPTPADAGQALRVYRRVLAETCSRLPMRGVDVRAGDPTAGEQRLGLANVYVHLNTTAQVPAQDAERPAGRRARPEGEETRAQMRAQMRAQTALEAAVAHRRLVLLGSPGGGKTTFVHHLAHCLAAHAVSPENEWLEHLPVWPAAEGQVVPIRVVLRDLAAERFPRRAEPRHLWDHIVDRLRARNLEFAAEPLRRALERGRALVLLDGLDEVPSRALRALVRDAVGAFVARYPDNRYLATCRVRSYQPPVSPEDADLRLPGFAEATLAPFDAGQIEGFVAAWYKELAHLGEVRSEDVPELARSLREAVQRPDLQRLAPNPLLLTVMALVHTHHGRLPHARAKLYEETVDILLWRWEQIKAGGQRETPRLQQLLGEAGRTDMDLKRVLWRLAYEAHAQVGEAGDDRLGDIDELRLEKALAALKEGDRNWAAQVVQAIKLRAGLLLEREPERFSFPHRTFQEYLAGAYLSAGSGFARSAAELAEQGAAWWQVILLAVGRLFHVSGDVEKPLALVAELCPQRAVDADAGWRKAWLAGEALGEIGAHRVRDSQFGQDLLDRVRGRLVALLERGRLAPQERSNAGDVLAALGDPRPGVGVRADGLPDVIWCDVPGGPFVMGEAGSGDASPEHPLSLPAFRIARYPVTNAQYAAFVRDGGYAERWRSCWTEAGWRWKGRRAEPDVFGGVYDLPNHPVVMVRWYEAHAFCRWLTARLRQAGELAPDKEVTLPSEAQWEKAARGTDGRAYPWGNGADPQRANVKETGIDSTSAVGCFPGGAGPYGCLDMAGNVWEWTRSLWGIRSGGRFDPEYGYPYDVDDGREKLDVGNEGWRVLRGGAFYSDASAAGCAVRDWNLPGSRGWRDGFRIVVSPISRSGL